MPVTRSNLSGELLAPLREMILDGRLGAGARINEVHLAATLGVSRTPLREALSQLAAEGALTAMPRLGYFVCPLTAEEVEHLYPMRAILDPAALGMAGRPAPDRIAKLKRLNRRFAEARDPLDAVRIDDEWHLLLLADCPNPILLGLIEQFIWRTRRYELGLMRASANVSRSTADHDRIIAALENDDLDAACAALQANMLSGKRPILDWLREREGIGE